MGIRKILTYPDPFLKEKARSVEKPTKEVRDLLDDMVETMRFNRGIGLAATQVGSCIRALVLEVPENLEEALEEEGGEVENVKAIGPKILYKLVNPEIVEKSGSIKFEEGCLSLPGIRGDVNRFSNITVRAVDENNAPVEIRAEGLLAIAFQHEIDHLDGILFIDRVSRLKRALLLRKYNRLREDEEDE